MNPHADSVQQPSDFATVADLMRFIDSYAFDYKAEGKLATSRRVVERELHALLASFGTRPAAEPVIYIDSKGSLVSRVSREQVLAVLGPIVSALEEDQRAAEPSQSSSAGEALQDTIMNIQGDYDELQWKFEQFIDFATGGKLSKSSWALETLKAAVTEYVNETVESCEKDAALSRQAPAAPAEMPDGWKLVAVNEAFDGLMVALGRAERKGYMPDAVAEDWGLFEWNDRPAAPTPAAPAEALSEERLYDLADSGEANPDAGGWGPKFDFLAFARLVERAHGIGAAPTPAEPSGECFFCEGRGCTHCDYRTTPAAAEALMAMTEEEVDAELRTLGMEPEEALRRGTKAIEVALATIAAHKPVQQDKARDALEFAIECLENCRMDEGKGHWLDEALAMCRAALSTPPTPEAEPVQQDTKETCPICHGTGKHWMASARLPGQPEFSETMVDCNHCKTKAAPQAPSGQQAEPINEQAAHDEWWDSKNMSSEFNLMTMNQSRAAWWERARRAALAGHQSERPAPAGQAVGDISMEAWVRLSTLEQHRLLELGVRHPLAASQVETPIDDASFALAQTMGERSEVPSVKEN